MIDRLQVGAIEVIGRHPLASNAAFLVRLEGYDRLLALYKPVAGERPLWDFPGGNLAWREVAAYRFATALGLDCVPPTVWREDAPYGPGSLQRWVEEAEVRDVVVAQAAPSGWLPVLEAQLEDGTDVVVAHDDRADLRMLALLDALMNNADRKGGHLLRDADGGLVAVDHGVTFHHEDKLRTVLWGFTGDAFGADELALLDRLQEATVVLHDLLTEVEVQAVRARGHALRQAGCFPTPSPNWPAIPWPVF